LKKHSFISLLYSIFLLSGVIYLPLSVAKGKDVILVAAASDLKFAMDDIIRLFEKKKPDIKVETVYGSSGNFFNQIINGAPFDLYFSADIRYPEELGKRGLGKEVTVYAFGRMVVMAPVDSGIEIQKSGIKSLLHPAVKKIAIANPAHAPYGKAAVAFLKSQNIYETIKEKLVLGENISQAAQFVESGAAEAGIIALSLAIKAKESGRVSYLEIPAETYPTLEQGFTILTRTKKYSLVNEFSYFVQSKEGKSVLMQHGFDVPVGSRQ
ncbi:MAG: molybdate ABC transporter substrate-binding protein, partial [Nitrospinota bacterium]